MVKKGGHGGGVNPSVTFVAFQKTAADDNSNDNNNSWW